MKKKQKGSLAFGTKEQRKEEALPGSRAEVEADTCDIIFTDNIELQLQQGTVGTVELSFEEELDISFYMHLSFFLLLLQEFKTKLLNTCTRALEH